MSEQSKKTVSIDPAVVSNVKCSALVIETYVIKDGTSFLVIKNPKGEVVKYLSSPEELSIFFDALIKMADDEHED